MIKKVGSRFHCYIIYLLQDLYVVYNLLSKDSNHTIFSKGSKGLGCSEKDIEKYRYFGESTEGENETKNCGFFAQGFVYHEEIQLARD